MAPSLTPRCRLSARHGGCVASPLVVMALRDGKHTHRLSRGLTSEPGNGWVELADRNSGRW